MHLVASLSPYQLTVVIFTNPDTLHITIMPNEEKWRSFLKNLKYVVVDGNIAT